MRYDSCWGPVCVNCRQLVIDKELSNLGEYQKACNTVNQVLRMTWSIISKTDDEKTRLQALALINEVNRYRTELVTNGVIVNDALRIVQSKMEHLNGEMKDKKLLHDIREAEAEDIGLSENSEWEEEQPTHNEVF
jgi:hypothetical protein